MTNLDFVERCELALRARRERMAQNRDFMAISAALRIERKSRISRNTCVARTRRAAAETARYTSLRPLGL